MKKNNEIPKDKLNRLRSENEEKKKKLTEDHGAFFGNMAGDNHLPPEIESQFLDSIMAFENAFQSANRVQLYDFLEQPFYRNVEEMTDEEVTVELDRILALMNSKMISLDSICEVNDREMYRFITQELFLEEKDDINIPGMISHYTYEEFHPNQEHDIRYHSNDFVSFYLDKESNFYLSFLTTEAENEDWHLHFRQAFSIFTLNNFEINELEYDTEKAKVLFDCDFVGQVEGSEVSLRFLGPGEINLLYQGDFWCVDNVQFPKNTVC